MISLAGKRIFISAASAGMGYSVARHALDAGARVFATDIASAGLEILAEEGAKTAILDITDEAAVNAYFNSHEAFDGIVNMAGWVHHGSLLNTDSENWQRSFAVNVDSMFYVISASLPKMIEAGGGSIVNMASLASSVKGFPQRTAYSASKAAVIGLTKSIAVDYMADNIRCNALCPGTIETPSLQGRMASLAEKLGSEAKAREWFIERQPMRRLGQPDEIAAMVLYLLSDVGGYATGQPFIIDGGTIA